MPIFARPGGAQSVRRGVSRNAELARDGGRNDHWCPVSETIITRAPTRIDFGGGWTDVPPYSDEVGGFVCNVAINRYATVTIRQDGSQHPETDQYFGDRSIATAA